MKVPTPAMVLLLSTTTSWVAQAFLIPPAVVVGRHRQPKVHHRGRVFMQIKGDVLRNDDAQTSEGGGGAGGASDDASWQSTVSQGGARPEWMADLLLVRQTKLVRVDKELRQVQWLEEDDEKVESYIRKGEWNEAEDYFEIKKRQAVPIYRQTLRYHWTQTDTEIVVAVPVPRAIRGSNLHLLVEEEGMELALPDDPTFGVISGKFAGKIDPTRSGWQLATNKDGSFSISLTLRKVAQKGTYSYWYSLFGREKPHTTLRFKGSTDKYSWSQSLDFVNVFIPVEEGVRAKSIDLQIDNAGQGMTVRFPSGVGDQGMVEIDGKFCGLVKPEECSWVIDEDDTGRRCICLSLMKRVRTNTESSWWSRLFTSEEDNGMPDLSELKEVAQEQERERSRVQRGPEEGEAAKPAAAEV